MREIKFRAWDGKKIIPEVIVIGQNRFGYFEKEGYENVLKYSFKGVLMQYTGVKDKNGVEIYEGDILEFPFEWGIVFVINDGFRFAVKSPGSSAVDYERKEVLSCTTIIGNIYENPELISDIILADA